jgi:aspartyl-tRNA(Asn)/glutamyl-tRNA(Gln) amidotransferase subunit A
MSKELARLKAHECQKLLKDKEVSAQELVQATLNRMEELEPKLNAFIRTLPEEALEAAKAVDHQRAAGEKLGPLAGIPIALKDNLCTEGITTTCGSRMLENFVPPYTATAVQKVLDAGAIPLGKTNMDEFAMGSSTESSYFGPTKNPWDTERVPGGSSGGSAAAIASDGTILALGSDTGGSIRQPACYCGVTGLKPTYGRVSRYGLVAYGSSLDQIGPITKDVRDAALLLEVISGGDPMDATSHPLEIPDFSKNLTADIKGLKIGIPKECFAEGLSTTVRQVLDESIKKLESLGAKVLEVSLPHTEYGIAAYYLVATAEASSNLARYDGVVYGHRTGEKVNNIVEMYMKTRAEGFGPEVQRRIMLGTYVLSAGYYDAYYIKACQVRTKLREDFDSAFEKVDTILMPVAPDVPFKIGQMSGDPLQMYLVDVFTVPINMVGLPAISIPGGFSPEGLPVGIQFIGRVFDEATILKAAYSYEQNTDFLPRRPQL